jgi:hypothetical protein
MTVRVREDGVEDGLGTAKVTHAAAVLRFFYYPERSNPHRYATFEANEMRGRS